MTPSPMNLSTVPPSSDIAEETSSRYVEIWTSRSAGARVSEWLEKFSRSEKNTVRKRGSTPKVSGMPDLISCRTTSSGTKEENDLSEVRNREAADSSLAISWILDGGRAGVSKFRLSIACNWRDTFSTGRDSRPDAK